MSLPVEVLTRDAEPLPAWLADYRAGDAFPKAAFFGSRTVYYPGSATDGHPLRTFGKAHAAHCFVYVDNHYPAAELEAQLRDESNARHPKGYRVLDFRHLEVSTLTPSGWSPEQVLSQKARDYQRKAHCEPFAVWSVLERHEDVNAEHGPARMAYLHVGGDGVAYFDGLFCQEPGHQLPYAILLHDHGFGGCWTRFGGDDSPLLQFACASHKPLPQWLLVAANTTPWDGYAKVSSGDVGGMNHTARYLHRRIHEPHCCRMLRERAF